MHNPAALPYSPAELGQQVLSVLSQVQGLIRAELPSGVPEVCTAGATLSEEVAGGLLGEEKRRQRRFCVCILQMFILRVCYVAS